MKLYVYKNTQGNFLSHTDEQNIEATMAFRPTTSDAILMASFSQDDAMELQKALYFPDEAEISLEIVTFA